MTAERPDTDRLYALAAYSVMDTPLEKGFDDLARIAALLCGTPTALVTFVDGERQFFKAREGFDGGPSAPLDVGFCPLAVRAEAPLIIHDTLAEGYGDNAAVTEGGVRFYAGMPLRTASGAVLGTLCVLDRQPRPDGLAPAQIEGLERLADQVVSQLELRRAAAERAGFLADRQATARERRAYDRTQRAIVEAAGDLTIILDVLVAGAMEAVPAADGGVMELLDAKGLEYRATRGSLTPHRGVRVPLDGSTSGACARTGEPVLLADALSDPRTKADLAPIIGLRSAVHAPVTRAGRVLGVLKLQSGEPGAFTPRDLDVVAVFAGLATAGLTEASEADARRAVRASDARYRAVFDSAIDFAIVVMDLDGRVTDWNAGATRILGWEPAEVRGKSADLFFTPEDREAGIPAQEMQAALDTGRGLDERWHLRKGGARFFASGEMMPLRDDGDAAIGFLKILRDRTEQRRQEEALRAQSELLQTVTDHVGQAVFQMDAAGTVAFANPAAEAMFGWSANELNGRNLHEVLHHSRPDGSPFPAAECQFVDALRHGRALIDREDVFFHRDGTPVRVLATNAPVHTDGSVASAVLTVSDITERRAAEVRQAALLTLVDRLREASDVPEMTRAAAEIVGRTLGVSRVSFGLIDAATGTLRVEPDWTAQGHVSIEGLHSFADYGDILDDLLRGEPLIIPDVTLDPRTASDVAQWRSIGVAALLDWPVRDHGRTVAIYLVHHHQPRAWTDTEIAFVKAVADRVDVGVARVRAEERRQLLNHELSHRLKNTLAMVQAIASQTLRNITDPDAAREALAARLIALGKAHDILMTGDGERADMRAVIVEALAIHDDGRPGRFRIDGPPVVCGDKAALSLALMVHELATNAAKYGALSVETGHVEVTWIVAPSTAGEAEIRLTWRERGGPPVAAPTRKGFGTRLIERGLAGAVGGTISLRYAPDGVRCEVVAPLTGFAPGP